MVAFKMNVAHHSRDVFGVFSRRMANVMVAFKINVGLSGVIRRYDDADEEEVVAGTQLRLQL